MRLAVLVSLIGFIGLIIPGWAPAFDIEERQVFDVSKPASQLRILSTADLAVFAPYITAFQRENPGIAIDYTVASSTEVMKAIFAEGQSFDLVISSAMDLQTKLANDGFARTHLSDVTAGLPDWARWRDQVIAFTQEPAVMILSEAAFEGLSMPQTRAELISILRAHPERFRGRVGTYDIRTSGLGYLFATQDSRVSESFWPLMEVLGRLQPRLYCCSGAMIEDVITGRLAIAYNVLGSYAERRLADQSGIRIVHPSDATSLMLRTAIIPTNAQDAGNAGRMIDFLAAGRGVGTVAGENALPRIRAGGAEDEFVRPIRLGPELLVFLDAMRRKSFLQNWSLSVEQLDAD